MRGRCLNLRAVFLISCWNANLVDLHRTKRASYLSLGFCFCLFTKVLAQSSWESYNLCLFSFWFKWRFRLFHRLILYVIFYHHFLLLPVLKVFRLLFPFTSVYLLEPTAFLNSLSTFVVLCATIAKVSLWCRKWRIQRCALVFSTLH